MTHHHVYQRAVPSPGLIFDSETYDLDFEADLLGSGAASLSVPTLDYAIHLINVVKFHCCQLFHLFEEGEFMGILHEFYAQTPQVPQAPIKESLWYVHFLLLVAFGKAFVSKSSQGRQPPGAEFFIRAMQILPNMVVLSRDPIQATEVLCCIALYLQCLDHRISAYNFVSTARAGYFGRI